MTDAELRDALGSLVADFDFLELHMRLRNPNVFTLFQMEYVEPKLSAFLAWLLDPNAGHGLEDRFLRRFLAAALASPPPDAAKPLPQVSPIPYEAVCEKTLKWDKLDVMSADLRDTMVSTAMRRRNDARPIDICLWNDSYSLAVYVENRIQPRHSWRIKHGVTRFSRPYESERYLLDLYSQWGSDDAGGYEILPVFLSLGGAKPSETRCFHLVTYSWMPGFLEASMEALHPSARPLVHGFCQRIRLEMPKTLDPELYDKLTALAERYGEALSRLTEHVLQCTGCEDTDLTVAYHDIYRRNRLAVEYLSDFVESLPDERTAQLAQKLTAELPKEGVLIDVGPASLAVSSSSWTLGGTQPAIELSVSLHARSISVTVFAEQAVGKLERLLAGAQRRVEQLGFEWTLPRRLRRTFRLVHKRYDEFDELKVASDCVALFQAVTETCTAVGK